MAKKKTNEEEVDDSKPNASAEKDDVSMRSWRDFSSRELTPNASAEKHNVSIETNWQKIGKDPDAVIPAMLEMLSGALKPSTEMPRTIVMVSFERVSGKDKTHLSFNTSSIEEAAATVKKAMNLLPSDFD